MEAILKKEVIVSKAAAQAFGVLTFVVLISLGAFVRLPLPFTPVPVTLQTFFVLLSAACLGSRLAITAQLGYILLGVSGVPVFAGAGSGMVYLLGPTAGYIFGFIFAAGLIGRFVKSSHSPSFTFLLFCLGSLIILIFGIIWLKIIFGYSLAKLLLIGLLPFLPADIIKALAASIIYAKIKTRLKEIL